MVRMNSIGVGVFAAFFFFRFPAIAVESMTQTIETYFAGLKGDCALVARSNPVADGKQAKEINACFKKTVKKHQPLTAFMKADSKGIVVSWYVRNEKVARKKLSVAKQPWFQRPQKTLKEYDCLLKDENGRYYIYWSFPLVRSVRGVHRFDGTVIAKVDLWDCFHKIASRSSDAFLIRLNTKALYGHLWENKRIFVEDPLTIAGIYKISVRYQKSGVSVIAGPQEKEGPASAPQEKEVAASAPQENEAASAEPAQSASDEKNVAPDHPDAPPMRNNIPIIIGLIIIIAVVLTLLIMQMVRGRRPPKRMRSFNRDDRFQNR